jgi:hypothetical protein
LPATDHLDFTFGIEIECYLPEGGSQASVAEAVGQRIDESVTVESYNHQVRTGWKVITDGSLQDYVRGIEFVSPILQGEAGLTQVDKVCQALSDFGCTVSRRCGLHVHVGVSNPELSFFKNVLKLYAVYEPIIDSIMPASRRASTNMFCRSMTAARPASIDGASSFNSLLHVATGERSGERRYYKLNLAAYMRHRTVEFRQHSGTLDARKTRMWTLLCLRMAAAAKRGNLNLATTAAGPTPTNQAKRGTKAYQVGELMLRPEGCTSQDVLALTGWPSVSMPAQAKMCGLSCTTQRTGRTIRYFARASEVEIASTTPITVEGLAEILGCEQDELQYMQNRVRDLSGSISWTA